MNIPDNEDEDNDDSLKVKISDNGDNNDDEDDKKIPGSLLVEGGGGEAVADVYSPPVHVYHHVVNEKSQQFLLFSTSCWTITKETKKIWGQNGSN